MNNEQILENWNLQFKNQKKLNIEETKKLIELANITDDEELKKEYFNQAILGTQHVIYNYLKNSKLYLLSSRENPTEDIIATVYETWIESIKSGTLTRKNYFTEIVYSKPFSNKVMNKLGIKQSLKGTTHSTNEGNNIIFSYTNTELANYFIKYYTAINSGKNGEEALSVFDNYQNTKDSYKQEVLEFFEKIANYIETNTENQELFSINLENYIEMVIANTIANSFIDIDSEIILVDYKYEDAMMYRELNSKMDNALNSLNELEGNILKETFGLNEDGEELPIDRVRKLHNISADKVKGIRTHALWKLRRSSDYHKIKDYLEITHNH